MRCPAPERLTRAGAPNIPFSVNVTHGLKTAAKIANAEGGGKKTRRKEERKIGDVDGEGTKGESGAQDWRRGGNKQRVNRYERLAMQMATGTEWDNVKKDWRCRERGERGGQRH